MKDKKTAKKQRAETAEILCEQITKALAPILKQENADGVIVHLCRNGQTFTCFEIESDTKPLSKKARKEMGYAVKEFTDKVCEIRKQN